MIDASRGSSDRTLLTLRSTTQDSNVDAIAFDECSSIYRVPALSVSFSGVSQSSHTSDIRNTGIRSWTSPAASTAVRVSTTHDVSHWSSNDQNLWMVLGELA